MEYFVEQGTSHRDVLQKVQSKYGERAKVLHYKTIRMGGFLGMFTKEGIEVTGYFGKDAKRETPPRPKQSDIEEEKRKLLKLGGVNDGKALEEVLKEVRSIKDRMDSLSGPQVETHESIRQIEELLARNEFSFSFITDISNRLKKDFSFEDLDDFNRVQERVIDWIADSVEVYPLRFGHRPEVFTLVGPTGVGKTTTIAKLSAMLGIGGFGGANKTVRILTIDNYRIGAKQQIETYGEIMNIPVSCVETHKDMEKYLALYADVDVIFIDTIGKSPRDFHKLAEMKELLSTSGIRGGAHLAVSATTKYSDLLEIIRQFEPFGYESLILTKLDETSRVGNIISALSDKHKSLSYITDGQRVPQDIEPASVTKLLMNLDGFRVNRERLERRFGALTVQSGVEK